MSGGLNEDNREEWQIVEPDDENGVLGWRVILVEETDGLFLEAHDEDDRRLPRAGTLPPQRLHPDVRTGRLPHRAG